MNRNPVFFDLETQNLFEDVGGRGNIARLRVACAVTWSSIREDFNVYWEKDVTSLITELRSADRVIGFNIRGFDYEVLKPYTSAEALSSIPTLDLMENLSQVLGFRPSLDSVASATLGVSKTADGVQSVQWFREGKLDQVAEYCKTDVDITRRVFEFGMENGYVNYLSKLGSRQRVRVDWSI